MQVKVLQEDLLKGLSCVSRFVSVRAQLPVLSNILLKAEKGKLKLGATNLETGIVFEVGAKIEEDGLLTVPAKVLLELTANLPPGQITLSSEQEQLKVSSGSFQAQLSGILASEFPSIPDKLDHTDFTISGDVLQLINKQVVFAAAQDDSRPILTGVLFKFSEDNLRAVATDGFRLSSKELIFNKIAADKKTLLVPAKLLDELYKIVGGQEIKVALMEREKQIMSQAESMVLTGRLLEGDYPDFERIIPQNTPHKASVDREAFIRAIRAAAVFAREASGIIKLVMEKDKIVVVAESQQYGREESEVEAKVEEGGITIAFNYRYILDFLNSVTGQEISIETEGTTAPGVFRDTKDPSYLHLIMPFKIQN